MTCAYIKFWNDQTRDVELFQCHFSTLLYLSLVFTVLGVLQLVGSACTTIFELNFCPQYPFGIELIIEGQHKAWYRDGIMILFGIAFLMAIETVDTIVFEVGNHLAIAAKAEFLIT